MGGQVAALSVDDPTRAEAMHAELQLNFPVLCDSQREVITAWGLLNSGEKGGIAYPAVFVIDPERKVRYRSLDRTASRVSTAEVVAFLKNGLTGATEQPRLHVIWPGLSTLVTALRSAFRHGVRVKK